jgi:hypothetical protein
MWLFTPFGFFSVVAHREKPDAVLVRSRAREDLAELVKRLPGKKPPIRRTPAADYPFRVELRRARVAELVRSFVLDELDYPNFKGAVAERQGFARAHAYHEVWSTLRGTEEPGARSLVAPSGSSRASISSR